MWVNAEIGKEVSLEDYPASLQKDEYDYKMDKTMLLDAVSTGVSYGTSMICQELGMPVCLTLILSMAAGMGTSIVGGKYLLNKPGSNYVERDKKKDYSSFADLMLPEDAEVYNRWMKLREAGLDQPKVNDIILTNKGYRPNPTTYLSKEYIDAHLAQFVMPKNYCDKISVVASDNTNIYEEALGFDIGHRVER